MRELKLSVVEVAIFVLVMGGLLLSSGILG